MDEVTASQVSGASLQNQLIANQHMLAPLLQPRETSEMRVRVRLLVNGYTARTCLCQKFRNPTSFPTRTESPVLGLIGHCRQECASRGSCIDLRLEYSIEHLKLYEALLQTCPQQQD